MPPKERKVGLKFYGEKGSGKVPFTQDLGYHLINFFNVHQQPIFIIIFRNFKRLLAQWMKS
jgi:hypothetical protein